MKPTTISIALASLTALAALVRQSEPAPRTLSPVAIKLDVDLADVAAVRELANGQLLVTDAKAPAILVIDPATGAARKLAREGQGPNEFGKPGGIYYDADGTTSFVMDRSQPRVLVVDRNGTLTGMRSIEQRGVRSSADAVDPMQVDATLHTYFVDRNAGFRARAAGRSDDSLPLFRFDVARQHADTAARLFYTKPTNVSTQGRMTFSRTPIFSPADGWAVARDGSIAVVRAVPYRVDWFGADGKASIGSAITFTPVEVTSADREAYDDNGSPLVSSSSKGNGSTMAPKLAREFAKVKPAFDPDRIVVSPDMRVWVGRQMPATAKQVVYDVFDRRGARVDRVAFPTRSRVVGFGPNAVFVSELDDDDLPKLRKYRLTK